MLFRSKMKYEEKIVLSFFRGSGVPMPKPEHRFHHERKWRFDFAWLDQKLALEVQGGIWSYGRHTRGAALLKEWEKLNTAASMGWRIMYVQPRDLCTQQTINMLKEGLSQCTNTKKQ